MPLLLHLELAITMKNFTSKLSEIVAKPLFSINERERKEWDDLGPTLRHRGWRGARGRGPKPQGVGARGSQPRARARGCFETNNGYTDIVVQKGN